MATKTEIKDYPVIELNVNDIKKDPTNPNVMTMEQERGLEKSIVKFGRLKHIVVDQDNVLIDGEHRLEVEKANGTEKVNVIQVTVKDEIERKMMRETLNKLHGTYNKEKESSELLSIFENQRLDELAELLAQPKQELENLISRYNPDISFEREEDETKLPSLYDTESFVKRGEIWQLGRHRLMCGDSHNDIPILLENEKPELLLTDPPYGMNLDTDWSDAKTGLQFLQDKKVSGGHKYDKVIGDNIDFNPQYLLDNFQYCKEFFLFGADYYSKHLPDNSGSWFVWDKRVEPTLDDGYGSQFELIWSKNKHKREIARVKWFGIFGTEKQDIKKRVHPTQKPLELFQWFIKKFSVENNIILDPFLGSGSTLIACEQTNRICYGMEIDEHYCSVIIKRWELYTGLKAEKVN